MKMRQWLTIHFEGQHVVLVHGVFDGKGAGKSLGHLAATNLFLPHISAEEHHFFTLWLDARLQQNVAQAHTAPSGISDQPMKQTSAVTTTLKAHILLDDRPTAQLIK